MLSDWKFWVLMLAALGALGFNVTNYQARNAAVAKQLEVLQRQQFINESEELSKFNSQFIRALASLAAQTNDTTITQILTEHGITYTVNENPTDTAAQTGVTE